MEVAGVVASEKRAPQGFELRLKGIRILSEPAQVLPLESINGR